MTVATDWTGAVGRTWAAEWNRTERALAGIAAALDAAILARAPVTGRAIDIGCGVGSTAITLARARPGLAVTGVDLSDRLVAVARDRSGRSGHSTVNLDFAVGDATAAATARAPLDLFVSRHGVMFFADPVAAFLTLHRSAAPGASLVFSCFRPRVENDWASAIDAVIGMPPVVGGYAPGPFGFADRAATADILAGAGWQDVTATAHDVSYVVGTGDDPVADALAFYRCIGPAAPVLAAASPNDRGRLERRLAAMLAERLRDGAVTFGAAIWIWTACAGEKAA